LQQIDATKFATVGGQRICQILRWRQLFGHPVHRQPAPTDGLAISPTIRPASEIGPVTDRAADVAIDDRY
jgi:hypothetical protein